jgi:hypothetical protein
MSFFSSITVIPPVVSSTPTKFTTAYSRHHSNRLTRAFQKRNETPESIERALAEWTPQAVTGRVTEFLTTIDTKDPAKLTTYNNGMFEGFWKLFTLRTGIKLPSSQRGKGTIIRDYVGPENYDAHQQHLQQKREQRESERLEKQTAAEFEDLQTQANRVLIRDKEGTIYNGDDYAKKLLAEGWTVENQSQGPVPRFRLEKGDLLKRIPYTITRFARALQLQAA